MLALWKIENNLIIEMVMENYVLSLDDLCAQVHWANVELHCSVAIIWSNEDDDNFTFFIIIFFSDSIFILSIQHYILLSITWLREDTVMILLLTRVLEWPWKT